MNTSSPKKPNPLRSVLFKRAITARGLAEGAGISFSLALKLMSGHSRPGQRAIQKIEWFLDKPIWSTRAEFKEALERRNRRTAAAARAAARAAATLAVENSPSPAI